MAPTFRSGKGSAVLFGSYDLTTYLNEAGWDANRAMADTTCFGSDDKTYIPGLREATIPLKGLFEGSSRGVDAVLGTALATSSVTPLTFGPEGSAIGRRAKMANVLEAGYKTSSPVADAVHVEASMQASTKALGGVFLKAATAVTTTGASASVDNGAASTGGATAHFHLVSQSTLTTVTVKVQHSSNDSAYADLITFTAATAETFQRSTVAGAIKRYTREIRTTLTGGAGKTVTHSVALART